MNRFLQLLLDPRVLGVLGLAALAAFLFLGADALQWGLTLAAIVFGLVLLTVALVWAVRRWRARRAAQRMEQELESTLGEADRAGRGGKEGRDGRHPRASGGGPQDHQDLQAGADHRAGGAL
jgi:type VI secretion system protein ImpL